MHSSYLHIGFWKRNFKFTTLRFLHFLFVVAFFFFLRNLENAQNVLNGQNEALSEKSTTYFTVNGLYELDLSCLITADEMEHTTLLLHEPSVGLDYEVLYTCGKENIFGGEFFEKQDFTSGTVSALLGCHLKENGEEIDTIKKKTNMVGNKVLVLGTLSPSANAAWNYSIFYTKGLLGNVDATSVFAISSTKKEYTDNAMNFLETVISQNGGTVQYSNFRKVTYQDFLGKNNLHKLLFYGLVVIVLLSEAALVSAVLRWRKTFCTLLFRLGSKRIWLREFLRLMRILVCDTMFCGILLYVCCCKAADWKFDSLLEAMVLLFGIGCVVNVLMIGCERRNMNRSKYNA